MTDFGLIGHPVAHSMSKTMQEAAFRELGLDYTYGLFDVSEDELKLFMDNADFRGLNVTIPLKVEAVKYMSELSPEASVIGAVNTIEFGKGRIGHNTDAAGFMKSLREADVEVADQTFLVLGAGGAGRSIVFKLAMEKARVYCFNRDGKKAALLSEEVMRRVGVRVEPAAKVADIIRNVDVLVNATPVGMHPAVDDTLVPKELMHPALTVMDLVYNPIETRLLREAKAAGCRTVDGVGMLVHQGAESLRIWLGREPPADAMREAVLDALKKPAQCPPKKPSPPG
jgi:shikimate dehydrogenase